MEQQKQQQHKNSFSLRLEKPSADFKCFSAEKQWINCLQIVLCVFLLVFFELEIFKRVGKALVGNVFEQAYPQNLTFLYFLFTGKYLFYFF